MSLGRTIQVPLDYDHPSLGTAPLYFELGSRFDRQKPVVFVIADGQQYFIHRGGMTELQQSLFGDAFNVVGIVTRGSTPEFIQAAIGRDGKPDWPRAWQIFNSEQWIGDIESVRKSLLRENGKIMLYGRSGGAYLVHEYLAEHADHVLRAFTQSPVSPRIVADLGIRYDHFWSELGGQSPQLQTALRTWLDRVSDEERETALITLQRQHFYVPADQLLRERENLIHAMISGDAGELAKFRQKYEVESVQNLMHSNDAIPQAVRVLEFFYPAGAFSEMDAHKIYPLLEPQRRFVAPLLALADKGEITVRAFEPSAVHQVSTELFVLAGKKDEAVDYRTSIALAYSYPRHHLFIADDNHVFSKLTAANAEGSLLQTFLRFGIDSKELLDILKRDQQFRWAE